MNRLPAQTRMMPLVVICTLVASIGSVAFLVKTVWFSPDHEGSCQDLRTKAFESLNRGDAAGAIASYEQAVKEAKSSDNLLQLPAVLSDLGDAYKQEKDFSKAEQALRASLQSYEEIEKQKTEKSSLGSSSLRTLVGKKQVEVILKLAKLFEEEGKPSEAVALYPRAMAKAKDIPDSSALDTDINKEYLHILEKTGQNDLAKQVRTNLAADSIGFSGFQNEIDEGRKMLSVNHIAEARESFQIAALIAGRHNISKNVVTAQTWLAACDLADGHPEAAERVYKEVLANHAEVRGMSDCVELTTLAACLELQNKKQEAEPFYKRALAINPEEAAVQLTIISAQYELKGEYAKSEPLRYRAVCFKSHSTKLPNCRTVIDIAIKNQDVILAAALHYLANNYHQQHKEAQARALYEADREIALKLLPNNVLVHAVDVAVASYFCGAGEYAKAETLYDKAIADLEAIHRKSPTLVSQYYAQAGNNCRALGKHIKAEALYRQQLNILLQGNEGRDYPVAVAQCFLDLTGELLFLNRFEDATVHCRRAVQEYEQLGQKDQVELVKNKEGMVHYLRSKGRTKAAQLLADQTHEMTKFH